MLHWAMTAFRFACLINGKLIFSVSVSLFNF